MIYEQSAFLSGLISDPELSYRIIDSLPFPVYYRDTQGVYVSCNKSFEKFIGKNREEIIGKMISEVHSVDVADILSHRDRELLDEGADLVYEHHWKSTGDSMSEVLIYKSAIKGNAEELLGIASSVYDVSDRRKAEAKIEKAKEASVIASAMLQKIRAGIVIVDHNLKVINCNETFATLMGSEIEELYEAIPGLSGADLPELVPEIIGKMFSSLMSSGEEMIERDITFQNKLLHISIVTIYKNRVVGAIIRNMSAPKLVREEIISRAMKVTRQNIEMVQKVATLLAENAAQTEDMLNSIVAAYKYSENRKDE